VPGVHVVEETSLLGDLALDEAAEADEAFCV
jgi:hypothetical protein